jgi:hypothetical protein
MVRMRRIEQTKGGFKVEGSSDTYATMKDAMRFIKAQEKAKKGKSTEGRRFHSERLQMDFRSTWEIELAELMTELGILFEYEPKRFYFRAERESYLPDFFLPEYNVWIEVKGWMDQRSYKRVTLFKRYHGKETGFCLYMKDDRELILKSPAALYAYINIAQEELERVKRNA